MACTLIYYPLFPTHIRTFGSLDNLLSRCTGFNKHPNALSLNRQKAATHADKFSRYRRYRTVNKCSMWLQYAKVSKSASFGPCDCFDFNFVWSARNYAKHSNTQRHWKGRAWFSILMSTTRNHTSMRWHLLSVITGFYLHFPSDE